MTSFGSNVGYIDDLYEQYLRDPSSVSDAWQEFFADYEGLGVGQYHDDCPVPGQVAMAEDPASAGAVTVAAPAPQTRTVPSAKTTSQAVDPQTSKPADAKPARGEPIRGASARIVENMEISLGVPTATTVRDLPVKLLEENRRLANQHQLASANPKLSFTHIIAWAVVRSLVQCPTLFDGYEETDGKPHRIRRESINLGVAIDVEKRTGERMLYVPNIKDAGNLAFGEFVAAFNDLVVRARKNKLTLDDFKDTGVSITNPGMLGTVLSVPRLMTGQGTIVGIGSIGYPPHCAGMTADAISQLGLSKVMTLTSTYDHRIIGGAESGAFLSMVERHLLGAEGFYDDIFEALAVPQEPIAWSSAETGPQRTIEQVGIPEAAVKQANVLQLIRAYRVRGHLMAKLDPLGDHPEPHSELELYPYGLSLWDLDRFFLSGGVGGRGEVAKLRDLIDVLREAYCRYTGVEFMYIPQAERREWIQDRVEAKHGSHPLDLEGKLHILEKLNAAEAFEKFLGKSYIGQKRFSLEGCETLIPVMEALLADAAGDGVGDVVIGMAHRGRLNVLVNVVGKSITQVFREFEDIDPDTFEGSGDVKYHQGARGTYRSREGKELQVTLASNPSHLEAVNPVVEGMARALLDGKHDRTGEQVLPVLVHGDAAFAGQGVVFETLNMSQLEAYDTGGTVHIIVNNQIGFTTDPRDSRSSHYCTDVAKAIGAPVFHVSADHPQAAVHAMRQAFAYRQEFRADVVLDLVGYRRWGHNEADEPALTQPLMYEKIRHHRSVRKLCLDRLLLRREIDVETGEKLLNDFQAMLLDSLNEVKAIKKSRAKVSLLPCREATEGQARPSLKTSVAIDGLDTALDGVLRLPADFNPHPKLTRLFDQRRKAYAEDRLDWGLAESLAFATIVRDGIRVRISGEDCGRGTFNQRHARVHDSKNGESYIPLQHLHADQATFQVYNSLLSEYAVLGFEYGYSVVEPRALVMWEAQFGDFVNGAQIIIDQFLSSAEEKWGQTCSLVMLLPHGYEGQGSEHSSARLERFLQLASEGNMQIVNATTAAQYFHLIRRQVISDEIKPLVVMSPKSLLRLPAAASPRTAFTEGTFKEVLDDPTAPEPSQVNRVILCSGKVYYDVAAARDELQLSQVALVRLEQFYPFPGDALSAVFERYSEAREITWLQEEPRNMGGWDFVDERLRPLLREGQKLMFAGRTWAASPASGSHGRHLVEQDAIVEQALDRASVPAR